MHYIYKITNKINNKCYIGYTSRTPKTRFHEHCLKALSDSKVQAIHEAIRKYGKDAFKIEVLEESEDGNYLLNEREQYHIDQHNSLYNMATGGIGGDKSRFIDYKNKKQNPGGYKIKSRIPHTEEYRLAISKSMKGNTNWKGQTDQSREKMKLANLGKPKTEEAKRKMSIAAKNRPKFKCHHCKGMYWKAHYVQFHGDKCKMKINETNITDSF